MSRFVAPEGEAMDADGEKDVRPTGRPGSVWHAIVGAGLGVAATLALIPHFMQSSELLRRSDDPVVLSGRALQGQFDATAAGREIDAALAAGDVDLARSFVALAQGRDVALAPAQLAKVTEAEAAAASVAGVAGQFSRGLVFGEADDVATLAGAALGDLFVFGDIRDALREGVRWANGGEADRVVLGLSCVGIAISAGTYASLGGATPARVGLSLVKAARKTGRFGARLGDWMARALHGVVDWSALRRALGNASASDPAFAVRAAREAIKAEKAGDLLRFARDLGTVQGKAGSRAAMDSLKIAETPKDMARIARLAEAEGGRTRAILKVLGRGAIVLGGAAIDIAFWLFSTALTVFGTLASLKSAVERATRDRYQRRKRRATMQAARLATATAAV
jgi:hypothetical protein